MKHRSVLKIGAVQYAGLCALVCRSTNQLSKYTTARLPGSSRTAKTDLKVRSAGHRDSGTQVMRPFPK